MKLSEIVIAADNAREAEKSLQISEDEIVSKIKSMLRNMSDIRKAAFNALGNIDEYVKLNEFSRLAWNAFQGKQDDDIEAFEKMYNSWFYITGSLAIGYCNEHNIEVESMPQYWCDENGLTTEDGIMVKAISEMVLSKARNGDYDS